MPRTDLKVPFHQKDEAKRLGAKWDAVKKVWYVPDGLDVKPFQEWMTSATNDKVPYKCPQCGAPLVRRMSRWRAKLFFGCSRYPKCHFRWS